MLQYINVIANLFIMGNYLTLIGQAVEEEKMFEIVDDDNNNADDDGRRSMGIL